MSRDVGARLPNRARLGGRCPPVPERPWGGRTACAGSAIPARPARLLPFGNSGLRPSLGPRALCGTGTEPGQKRGRSRGSVGGAGRAGRGPRSITSPPTAPIGCGPLWPRPQAAAPWGLCRGRGGDPGRDRDRDRDPGRDRDPYRALGSTVLAERRAGAAEGSGHVLASAA